MKVWQCYFESCNSDSDFRCQVPALQRESGREEEGGDRFSPNRVCHPLGLPDRWVMNTV